MINTFKNVNELDHIQFEIIDARGQKEDGRGLGAKRDLYALFWSEVADSLCVGASERVPLVRHDLYKKEWESIGRILRRGFVEANYFPAILSKAFIIYCLFGTVSNDLLVESFLNFVSSMEKALLQEALKTTNADIYEDEDFLELLDRFNCRSRVHPLKIYGEALE